MIRIRLTTTKGQIQKMAMEAVNDVRNQAIRILQRAGESAVNEAKSTEKQNDWHDDTANLRSSIGYIVCEDGKPISVSDFKQEKPTATEGPSTGKEFALRLAAETEGLALIVVAGMNYAKYVAGKGYNVLSSAQIVASDEIQNLFKKRYKLDNQ